MAGGLHRSGKWREDIKDEMMKDKDKKKLARVTEAFLKMKKFDIKALKKAYEGK